MHTDLVAFTLTIDCGGGGIKGSVLDEAGTMRAQPLRVPTPYPLPPDLFVKTLIQLGERLPTADRVTVGMPGMLRPGSALTGAMQAIPLGAAEPDAGNRLDREAAPPARSRFGWPAAATPPGLPVSGPAFPGVAG